MGPMYTNKKRIHGTFPCHAYKQREKLVRKTSVSHGAYIFRFNHPQSVQVNKAASDRSNISTTHLLRNAISLHPFPHVCSEMHSINLSLSLFPIIIFFFIFSVDVTTSSSTNETFSNCTRTFTCGSFHNITYPFTGGDRPYICGPPEFRLSCRNEFPELTVGSLTYRVLQINQTRKTLILARLDLWNNTCTKEFTNSTFNFPIFTSGVDNEDLTLVYACSPISIDPYNQFSCNVSGSSSDAYYLIGPVPSDPILSIITCNVSVTVPILRVAANRLKGNQTSLGEVLTEGFNVNYTIPYDTECSACLNSGGQCGYYSELGKFACFCGDQLCRTAGKKSVISLPIGIAIGGAGIVGLFLGFLFFYCRQRKKRLVAQSKSKDLPTPPSSKGLTTPTTNSFQSIPSYPFTKSDLEKGSTYFGVQVFSYTELEEATDNFDPSRELGEGGFGTVYYGNLRDGRVVAVKRLYENNFKRVEQFMNEVGILTRLRHKNLVMLYGCTSKRSRELLLVYEYIPNGTVADHLHGKKSNSGLLTWPVRLSIAIETADALAYLHVSDIIHRDVKTNNILLDNDFRVKVADFGLSRLFPTDCTHVSTAPQGTPGYVDPEYYQCYQLTDKSDVYSFGVVLMELVSSKEAVDTNRHRHDINLANMAINKIQNHTLHELVDPCLGFETDDSMRRMITAMAELAFRCLQQERDMRPSMEEVLEVLRGIENEDFNAQKAEVVDIRADDIGLLKSLPPPISPDSVVSSDKWVPYTF